MTWHWLSFLSGAPFWGSISVAIFAALARRRDANEGRARTLEARIVHSRRAAEHPEVISLGEYRIRKLGRATRSAARERN